MSTIFRVSCSFFIFFYYVSIFVASLFAVFFFLFFSMFKNICCEPCSCVRKTMLSSSIYYRKHNTVKSALREEINQVRTDQSATTQSSRQNWREPASRRAFTARRILQTNEEIKIICPVVKTIQPLTCSLLVADAMCIGFFHLNPTSTRPNTTLAASELFSWRMELLTFASRQFTPKSMDLSVHFSCLHNVLSSLMSAADGGRRPRSEAPCAKNAISSPPYREAFVQQIQGRCAT